MKTKMYRPPKWSKAPLDTPHPKDIPQLPGRFRSKVRVDPATGCWLWQASTTGDGYARFGLPGGRKSGWALGHRYAFAVCIGRIPRRLRRVLVFDHLCRRPSCVNPWHVEPVRQGANIRRGVQSNDYDRRCRSGRHPWTPEMFIVEADGTRRCRPCRNGAAA